MKGPTKNDEPQHKSGMRYDYSKDIGRMKCKSLSLLPNSYDEAKASCKARKRKERQESISSLCQERKVIRSNSEERPNQKKHFDNKNMRRVSSSEDFQKAERKIVFDKIESSPKHTSTDILIYDDYEHEKRRSNERFAKPLTLKNKKTYRNKKPKSRYLLKPKFKPEVTHEVKSESTDSDQSASLEEPNMLNLNKIDKERSPSPTQNAFAPNLDLSTLHQQVDCSEPLLSSAIQQISENIETLPSLSVASNRLLSSPRNSIIATHRIYLDPDVQQSNINLNEAQNPVEQKLQKLTKQINSFKKKIKKYEIDFETQNGFKLSHTDKLSDKNIRKLYLDLSKLKKEQKQLVDTSTIGNDTESDNKMDKPKVSTLQETLIDIEKKLSMKRSLAKRGNNLEVMSNDELLEEKIAIQKALLHLESIHGRPNSKEDRNLVRPIYDRYRNLKRLLAKTNSTVNELATIHEDETMNFITTFPQQINELDSEKSSNMTSTDSSDTDTSINENLHSLSRTELIEQHKLMSEEKKELRRTIKSFEAEVQRISGKMLQKDDKLPIEHVYAAYKKVKAKLKLLDALVGKL